MALVLNHSRASSTDRLVLIGIANHESDGEAWPGVDRLARYAAVSGRTVQRAIANLVELGELEVVRQGAPDARIREDRRPNLYRILLTCPETCDRTTQHRVIHRHSSGVTPTSPRSTRNRSRGDTGVANGVTPTSPKPSGESPDQPQWESQPQNARACDVCSLDRDQCLARARTSGHTYTPRAAWKDSTP